jgi:hypothetical protein
MTTTLRLPCPRCGGALECFTDADGSEMYCPSCTAYTVAEPADDPDRLVWLVDEEPPF